MSWVQYRRAGRPYSRDFGLKEGWWDERILSEDCRAVRKRCAAEGPHRTYLVCSRFPPDPLRR